MSQDDAPVSFLSGRLARGMARRVIRLPAGAALACRESDWRDTILIVEHGHLEIEDDRGYRHRFDRGAVLTLADTRATMLRNSGTREAVLVAVRRRRGVFALVRRHLRAYR